MTSLNSAILDVEDATVLMTLLTGADAPRESAETLTIDDGVVLEEENEDEEGFDMEGGPEPAAACG